MVEYASRRDRAHDDRRAVALDHRGTTVPARGLELDAAGAQRDRDRSAR